MGTNFQSVVIRYKEIGITLTSACCCHHLGKSCYDAAEGFFGGCYLFITGAWVVLVASDEAGFESQPSTRLCDLGEVSWVL